MTPTTPIIYGNGTMLSDIGEVTEAESTPGRKQPRMARRTQDVQAHDMDSPLHSSPTMGYTAVMKRSKTGSHHRTVSTESTSTVTTEGQAAEYFEDFDDGVSVDDSNFQGDDEESVVDGHESYAMEAAQARIVQRKEGRVVGGDDASQSSAALSRRAEMILANAKKRLDVSRVSPAAATTWTLLTGLEHGRKSYPCPKLPVHHAILLNVLDSQQQSIIEIDTFTPRERSNSGRIGCSACETQTVEQHNRARKSRTFQSLE